MDSLFARRSRPRPVALSSDLLASADADAAAARAATGGLATGSWWAARAAVLQQRLLARGAASLRAALLVVHARCLAVHARCGPTAGRGERVVAACAQVEAALMEHEFRRGDCAAARLGAACAQLRFAADVTGELGVRTVHQQESKAQLMVRATIDPLAGATEWGEPLPPLTATGEAPSAAAPSPTAGRAAALLGERPEESDVLHAPALAGGAAPSPLPCAEQACLLACALGVRRGRACDELRAWEMAPFVEAVRSQARGAPALRAAADLLAARHERTRSRTRVRALVTLEALAGALVQPYDANLAAARSRLAFAAWLPPSPSLRRELGEQLLAAGLVGEAMGLFEALQLWDALTLCLQLAGKRAEAAALARRRLVTSPGDARLWCCLGDATGEEAHYRTALTASGGRSARAHRSLARAAAARGDWAAAAAGWEAALAINPLAPDGWFGLGYASLKAGGCDARALVAFSRVTQQEPENGEAWNNVAALSLAAGRPAAALAALTECVRHKRDDWHVWDNLATVAARAEAWPAAAHAALQLAGRWPQHAPDRDVLEGLAGCKPALAEPVFKACAGRCPEPWFWRAFGRVRLAAGDALGAAECAARELRALQDGPWDRDPVAFAEFAACLAAVAQGRLEAGDAAGARLALRGPLKRTAERFGASDAWLTLERVLLRADGGM